MSFQDQTAEYWIQKLGLWPHPGYETGYLNEVFRDTFQVAGWTGDQRNSATNIYFLHKPVESQLNDATILFRMKNNELLNFYCGHPLTLYIMEDAKANEFKTVVLGPNPEEKQCFFYAIPRNTWFVRRLETSKPNAFTLIGCTVVPGYDDNDIETKTWGEIKSSN